MCVRSARVLAALSRRSEDPAAMGAAAPQEAGDFRRSSIKVHLHAAAGGERVVGTGPPAAQGPVRAHEHTLQVAPALCPARQTTLAVSGQTGRGSGNVHTKHLH